MKLIEISDKTMMPPMKWLVNPKQICCIHETKVVIKGTEFTNYSIKLSNDSTFIVSEEDFLKLVK